MKGSSQRIEQVKSIAFTFSIANTFVADAVSVVALAAFGVLAYAPHIASPAFGGFGLGRERSLNDQQARSLLSFVDNVAAQFHVAMLGRVQVVEISGRPACGGVHRQLEGKNVIAFRVCSRHVVHQGQAVDLAAFQVENHVGPATDEAIFQVKLEWTLCFPHPQPAARSVKVKATILAGSTPSSMSDNTRREMASVLPAPGRQLPGDARLGGRSPYPVPAKA